MYAKITTYTVSQNKENKCRQLCILTCVSGLHEVGQGEQALKVIPHPKHPCQRQLSTQAAPRHHVRPAQGPQHPLVLHPGQEVVGRCWVLADQVDVLHGAQAVHEAQPQLIEVGLAFSGFLIVIVTGERLEERLAGFQLSEHVLKPYSGEKYAL